MKRKHTWLQLTLLGLLLGIILLTLAPFKTAFAYSGNGDLIVHVTVTGECYHKAGCSYLKSDREMPLEEAYLAGYRPCSRCNPPIYTGTAKRSSSGNNTTSGTVGQRALASISQENNHTAKSSNGVVYAILGAGGTIAAVVAVKKTKQAKKLQEELQRQQHENERYRTGSR